MKKLALCIIFFITFFNVSVFANQNVIKKADPVSSSVDPLGGQNGYIEYSNGKKQDIDSSFKALYVNGSLIYNPSIITQNNRTLIPIRLVSENLGATVSWDDKSRTVTIKNDIVEIKLVIDKTDAKIDKKNVILDVAPKIYNNYTYLPLRFVSETLNSEVYYYDPNIDDKSKGIMYGIPTVFVDTRIINPKLISKEEAKTNIMKQCSEGLVNFKSNFKINYSLLADMPNLDDIFNSIQESINNIEFKCNVSRFYKFSGPYDVLFDKYSGDIFFIDIGRITTVKALDINAKDLYISKHFAG